MRESVSVSPAIGNIYLTTVQENFMPRFGISEYVTHYDRSTTFNVGGHYDTDRFSVSLGWAEQFLPFDTSAPFQKALTLSVSVRLPHGTSIQGQTLTDSQGHAKFTALGTNDLYGPRSTAGGAQQYPPSFGQWLIQGRVVDPTGAPVAGAALRIGKEMVFTDGLGEFMMRMKKQATYDVQMEPDSFTAPGRWRCVSGPSQVTSQVDTNSRVNIFVVSMMTN